MSEISQEGLALIMAGKATENEVRAATILQEAGKEKGLTLIGEASLLELIKEQREILRRHGLEIRPDQRHS